MSEGDYRKLLASLCADIDRRARRLGRSVKGVVLPAALGTAMALGAGACSESVNDYGAPPTGDALLDVTGRPDAAYMASFPEMMVDTHPADAQAKSDAGVDTQPTDAQTLDGPAPAYIAPDAN